MRWTIGTIAKGGSYPENEAVIAGRFAAGTAAKCWLSLFMGLIK